MVGFSCRLSRDSEVYFIGYMCVGSSSHSKFTVESKEAKIFSIGSLHLLERSEMSCIKKR